MMNSQNQICVNKLLVVFMWCAMVLSVSFVNAASARVSKAALGPENTCALLEYGGVKCWGNAYDGRIANGMPSPSGVNTSIGDGALEMGDRLPTINFSLPLIVDICYGYDGGCVLSGEGQVKCWGNGGSNLGAGSSNDIGDNPGEVANLAPVNLSSTHVATQIACGDDHTCAVLDDGGMKCWGSNSNGRLGVGSTQSYGDTTTGLGRMGDNLPYVKLPTGKVVKQIAAGYSHTCAITTENKLYCWGSYTRGRLGLGPDYGQNIGDDLAEMGDALPNVDLGTGKTAKKVSTGYDHTCVILNDDSLKCFGSNWYGQLGFHSAVDEIGLGADQMGDNLPTIFLGTGRTAIDVATGYYVTCALLDDQSVKCWGDGEYGQLMKGNKIDIGAGENDMINLTPINLGVRTNLVVGIYVARGSGGHVCAIHSETVDFPGKLTCWGNNAKGELGVGTTAPYGFLSGETGSDTQPADVDLGSMATMTPTLSPTALLNPSVSPTTSRPSASPTTSRPSLSPTTSRPSRSPTTSPSRTPTTSRPTQSPHVIGKTKMASLGHQTTCVLMSTSSEVKCFGRASNGRLGSGSSSSHIGDGPDEMGVYLQDVDLNGNVDSISAGEGHACALMIDGKIKCWGSGFYGQLGNEDDEDIGNEADEMGVHLHEVELGTGRTAIKVYAGDAFTCAILNGGSVKCWGFKDDRLGQNSTSGYNPYLGDEAGEMGDNLPFVDLGTGKTATSLALGSEHVCALLNDETVRCWGDNLYGQLGTGTTVFGIGNEMYEMGNNLAAVDFGPGLKAVQIAAGHAHTCALLNNNEVKCFGNNEFGQLGIGSTSSKGRAMNDMGANLTPVQFPDDRKAIKIAAGGYASCALLDDHSVTCWGIGETGQLMKGSTDNLGDHPDRMNFTSINLGYRTNQVVDVYVSKGDRFNGHVCVLHSSDLTPPGLLTCWGTNDYGELGHGNKIGYGAGLNEIGGDILPPIVDLGPVTRAPTTASPTAPTTLQPSKSPTTPTTFTPTQDIGVGAQPSTSDSVGVVVGVSVAFGLLGLAIGGAVLVYTLRARTLNAQNNVVAGGVGAEGGTFMMVPILNKGDA